MQRVSIVGIFTLSVTAQRAGVALAENAQRNVPTPNARPSFQSQEIQVQIVQGCHRDVFCAGVNTFF